MDYPQGQIAEIPTNMIDSAVYINSITYGRLGILTLETNEMVDVAKENINKIFKTIISSSSTTFSKEEQSFLDRCEFKVYLIGGNGSTSVQSFSGLNGFIQHIKKGTFSRDEPGTPIFCTFNHVKDNSPVSVQFRFSVKKEPLYVELKYEHSESGKEIDEFGIITLHFYKNRSKTPSIAHPALKFKIKVDMSEKGIAQGPNDFELINTTTYEFQNAGYQTSMTLFPRAEIRYIKSPVIHREPHGGADVDPGYIHESEYLLLNSVNFYCPVKVDK